MTQRATILLSIAETLLALFGAFLLTILLSVPFALAAITGDPQIDMATLLRNSGRELFTVQAVTFVAVSMGLIWLRVRRSCPIHPRWKAALWGLGAGLTSYVASLLLSQLLEWIGLPVTEQDWVQELMGTPGQLLALSPWIVLLVPFSEELFFRGYMMRFLEQRAGAAIGVGVSSLLFALVHLNASGIVIYLMIGLVLAWVYRRTASLVAPVVAHAVHNGVTLAGALWMQG